MKPGRSVASPRSMTWALGGTVPPIEAIRFPCTTITALRVTWSDVPSKRRAALMPIGCDCAIADAAANRRRRVNFLMGGRVYLDAMRVAYQGERGAFSETAARRLLGSDITGVPCHSFEEMFESVERG